MGKNRDERLRRQARERRMAQVRRRGRFTLVFAVLLGVAALVSPFGVRQAWTQERAFEQAVPCSFSAPLPDPSDCLLSSDGTVVSLHQTTGKSARQFVDLSIADAQSGDIAFHDPGFYNLLTTGQTLSATFWRNQVVLLEADGITIQTDDNPTGTAVGALTLALLVSLGALWLGYLTFWYLRRTERAAAIPAPRALVLPVRVAWTAFGPGLILAVFLGVKGEQRASVGSLLQIPLLLAAALALAASALFVPWMRRPGEVHFKH